MVQILEEQHQLSFHLQQQRLIELIRQGKTEEALEHAQEYLAPPGEEDPAFLEELGACYLNWVHSRCWSLYSILHSLVVEPMFMCSVCAVHGVVHAAQ